MHAVRQGEAGARAADVREMLGIYAGQEVRVKGKEKGLTCCNTQSRVEMFGYRDYSTAKEDLQMEREIENPMVCDNIWDDLDEIDRETREAEEAERFYTLADMAYDDM